MNNIQFQKNVSATQQPMQQLNSSPSLEDLVQQFQQNTMQIQQNNMQFQQNMNATMQELKAHIGQLTTTINKLQFEDSEQVPSQAILSPQENISDITVRSDMELPQQQSLKVRYGFSGNPDSENSPTVLDFADSSSVANSMLATVDSTKMTEIDDYVPTVSDLADVVKIANSMTDVTDLTDMTLDEILDQVTRVEIADLACADVDITNPMCIDAKMTDPRYANANNAFADRVEDVDSLVDKSDSVNMTEMADSVVSMSNHANILEVANSMMEVLSLANIIEVADSVVNISAFANMPEMSDSVANVSNFSNVVDNSNSADITKVLDYGIEVSDSVNNFLAHEPSLVDSGNQSRNRNQAKSVFDPKCRICNQKKVETDLAPQGRNLVWAESDSGEETNAKFDISIRARVEGNLDDENRKQLEAESISDNHVRWQEPIESDSSNQLRVESDSGQCRNLTNAETISGSRIYTWTTEITRDHLTLHLKSRIHSRLPSQESTNEPSSLRSPAIESIPMSSIAQPFHALMGVVKNI
ncbi:hypothetical protein CR513_18296, partial [Mucuna pruriens]